MKHALLALVLLAAHAAPAAAQTDFTALPLAPGDKVYIVDTNGIEVSGPLTAISRDTLSIGKYQFAAEPGLKIERSGDSLLNGTLIGAGIGAALGFSICGVEEGCAVSSGIVWGLFGALLDWAHVGRRTIYRVPSPSTASRRSLNLATVVTNDRKAVGVSLTF